MSDQVSEVRGEVTIDIAQLDPDGERHDAPPVHGTVADWLEVGFAANRDLPAIQFGDEQLTYAELDSLSNQIASYLTSQGVERGGRVGLCLDRSVELVACLLGVLKCGAAYVPLDPSYPRDRLAMMREDAALDIVVAHSRHAFWIGGDEGNVRAWADMEPTIRGLDSEQPSTRPVPDDAAYIIFTSGSTGRPKGVEMPHRGLANLIEWQLARSTFQPRARVLQYSSVSFDVSFQEIATTLASGGQLFMVADEPRRDPRVLLKLLREWRIDRLFVPFVALRSLVEAAVQSDDAAVGVTEIITAGEQLQIDDVMRGFFSMNPQASLDNQYGPSETHVITAHLLDGDPQRWPDLPPIGHALDNCSAYLLDEQMGPVGAGEIGEIYLGGRNLARGYFRRDDLTARAFVENPHRVVGRPVLYKTGDLALRDSAGALHYQGRVDSQIKIRGHRVEPGEINQSAIRFDGVAQCLTHAFPKPSGTAFLASYYTVKPDAKVEPSQLREHLKTQLPEYMVPSFVVQIDSIEYGPSGKADLRSLPDPRNDSDLVQVVHETETESRLAALWSEVLGFPQVPGDVSFFDLGGDSLAAVTLFLKIAETFGQELPLASLSQAPTIKDLADRLDNRAALAHHQYRSLQMLQDGPKDVPSLYLIHGGAGNVLVFSELASRLAPDQAVYAFQWSGWDGGRGERTIPEMAEAYKRELLRLDPAGPYRLGGHCIGGLIAIELARLLVAEGLQIDGPLVISDAPNVHAASHRREDPWGSVDATARFERLRDEVLSSVPSELRRRDGWRGAYEAEESPNSAARPRAERRGLRALVERSPTLTRWLAHLFQQARDARIRFRVASRRPVPIDSRRRYCQMTLIPAARCHRMSPYEGDVLYFRTATLEGRQMALDGWWDDVLLGFGELCTGHLDAHVVGGGHDDPLKLAYSADLIRASFSTGDTTSLDPREASL